MVAIPVRYRMVCGTEIRPPSVPSFERMVDEYLDRGWVLVGGPVMYGDRLYQAMIMPDDDNFPTAVHCDVANPERPWAAY